MNDFEIKYLFAEALYGGGHHDSWRTVRAGYPNLTEQDYLKARQAYLRLTELHEGDIPSLADIADIIEDITYQIIIKAKASPATDSPPYVADTETVASAPAEAYRIEELIRQATMTGGKGLKSTNLPGWSQQDLEIERNAYNALKAMGKRTLAYLQKHAGTPPIDQLIREIEGRKTGRLSQRQTKMVSTEEEDYIKDLVMRIHNPIINVGNWRDARMMGYDASPADFEEAERAADTLRRLGNKALPYLPSMPQNAIMDKLIKDLTRTD